MTTRLDIYLSNTKIFPIDIKKASIVSRLPRFLIKADLIGSGYFILNDRIYKKEISVKNFDKIKLSEVEEIYKQGYSFLVEDGHIMKLNNESKLCI
jgi:hypothetical protein